MSDTLWGTRQAGSPVAIGETEMGSHVIFTDVPDRVRTPPELGGVEFLVERAYRRACPCQGSHEAVTFDLTGSDLHVSECPVRGFLWWR